MKTYRYAISACILALALSIFTPSDVMAQKRKVTRKGVQTTQSAKTPSKADTSQSNAEESKSKGEMNQTLVVEREFAPVERDANKIERTPAAEQPIVTRSVVTYADWKANTAIDTLVTKLPVGQVFDDETFNTHRGYVDANLGNYWNTNIDAGYRVIEEEETTVLVNGGFRMSAADIASNHRDLQGVKLPDWKNRYYFGYADASLLRKLESMEVMAYLHYDYKNFSLSNVQLNTPYMHTGGSYQEEKYHWEQSASNKQQKLGDFRVGVKLNNEKEEEAQVHYNAGIEVEDFTISLPDVTELRFQLYGDIATQIEGYDCGLSTSVSGLNYSYTGRDDTELELYPRLKNGLQATLAPYIKIQMDSIRMRIGVRADYIGGAKPHFSIAPDIDATYTLLGGRRQFYGNVGGGMKRESQRQLLSRIPFYIPYQQYKNPWDLIDMTVGYRDYSWGDLNGEAYIGIKYTLDALIPIAYNIFDRTVVTLDNHDDLSFELGGKLHYTYNKFLAASAQMKYCLHTQKETSSYQPALQTELRLQSQPLKELNVELYCLGQYGRKAYWTMENIDHHKEKIDLKNITNLGAKGSWRFDDRLLVYLSFDNLLNQKYDGWAGIPAQGLNFHIGASYQF